MEVNGRQPEVIDVPPGAGAIASQVQVGTDGSLVESPLLMQKNRGKNVLPVHGQVS